MDVTEIEAKVKETLAVSIAYTVLIRCGNEDIADEPSSDSDSTDEEDDE